MLIMVILLSALDDVPRALMELQRSREQIKRADIAWERTDFRGSFVPGIPQRYRSAITEHESAFFADGTVSPDGMENGVTAWTAEGEPIRDSRYANLATAKDRWSFESDHLMGRMSTDPHSGDRNSDVRLLGLMPAPNLNADLSQLLRGSKDGPQRSYRDSVVDGLHVVECEFSGGEEKYVWVIDPTKDWNCVRAQAVVRGNVIAESLTEYRQAESGAWFPAAVDYYAANMEPLVHIDVTSARINSPNLPDRLTPEFIGFGSCMQVIVESSGGKPAAVMKYVADGRLATLEEYRDLLSSGETAVDARLALREEQRRKAREASKAANEAATARAQSEPKAAATQPADEWERYTLDFIRRFGLDSEQSQKAMAALLTCQQRRDAYLKSREPSLASLGVELLSDRDPERRKRIEARLELLRKPVDEIFEKQLKPRLEKLPTRKQIDAAAPESPAATRKSP